MSGIPRTPNGYNQSVMVRQLEAVFEHGVLRPADSLAFAQRKRVRLTLDDQPLMQNRNTPVQDAAPINDRREEFLWLANHSGPYADQWVALDGSRLIAHGTELAVVSEAARAAGVDRPLLTHLPPKGELPFGGW